VRASLLAPILLMFGPSGPGVPAVRHHYDYAPSWSPDGRHVLFSRDDRPFVVGSDGKHVRELSDEVGTAAWSPDGRAIVYTTRTEAARRGSHATDAARSGQDGLAGRRTGAGSRS
jgi:hypothetical protein